MKKPTILGLPVRRHARGDGGECTGHVNTAETAICVEKSMDARLQVPVAADELVLLLDAQNQCVRHDDRVNRDIHLMTVQIRGKSGAENPMTRSLPISKEAGDPTTSCDALNLRRHGLEPVKPEVQCRQILRRARSIEWRSAEKTMCSPDIPEGPDELARVAGGMDLRG